MRYFVGFMITIGLIIVLILLLFRGGGSPKVPKTTKALTSYSTTDAEVRLTIDGPINADQIHQQVQITVGQDDATYEQLTGYNGAVVNSQSYANTETAYNVFLHALAHAGFTRGDISKQLADERGYCPLGDRYIFELIENGKDIERYWSTSCGKPKTYKGNTNFTLTLFQRQIPDYSTLTQHLSL